MMEREIRHRPLLKPEIAEVLMYDDFGFVQDPDWLRQPVVPLCFDSSVRVTGNFETVYIGTSGLKLEFAKDKSKFEMHYGPNGDHSELRNYQNDLFLSAQVFAKGLLVAVDWLKDNKELTECQQMQSTGENWAEMGGFRLKLFGELGSDIYKVKKVSTDYIDDSGEFVESYYYDYLLDWKKFYQATKKPKFSESKLRRLASRLDGTLEKMQIQVVNPVLSWSFRETNEGLHFYDL